VSAVTSRVPLLSLAARRMSRRPSQRSSAGRILRCARPSMTAHRAS